MAIINIKNTALRRVALIVAIVPLMLASAVYEAMAAAWQVLAEVPDTWREVWIERN